MSASLSLPLLVIFALLISTPFALAQGNNFNSSNFQNCSRPQNFDPTAAVNSTGKTEFRFGEAGTKINKDAWYMSLTFNETRRRSDGSTPGWLQGWLSVPEATRGSACMYMFSGVNFSASGTGSNGCQGVLSPACISALVSGTQKYSGGCELFKITAEAKEHCGHGTLDTIFLAGPRLAFRPTNFTNNTCTLQSPPNISIPDGYRSRPVIGMEPNHRVANYSSSQWYDLHVQQPVPWVITSILYPDRDSDEIQRDTQVVCVTPNAVVEGGRKPEVQFKPVEEPKESTSSATLSATSSAMPSDKPSATPSNKPNNNHAASWRGAGPMAVVVAGAVCLGFMVW